MERVFAKNITFEKWAIKELKKIQNILLLQHFEPLRIEPSNKEGTSECVFHYPYQSITVRYSNSVLDKYKKGKYDDVLSVLVHEMCHSITDPLYSKSLDRHVSKNEIEDERERLTDHICNIILKNIKI